MLFNKQEAVSAAVQESMAASNGADEESSVAVVAAPANEQFSVLPMPNTNAKLPQDCYNLFEMLGISQEEFDRFTNDSALWLADTKVETVKDWIKTGAHSEFVCERLLAVGTSKLGHKQRMNKFKMLSLMRYLVALFKYSNLIFLFFLKEFYD